MRLLSACFLLCVFLCSCAGTRRSERFYAKTLRREIRNSPVFQQSFTGFTLLDPATGRTLCDVNSDHYFIPASNTKIMTLYACLKLLGDSLPGMKMLKTDETTLFRGTGDPTFLHPDFQRWQPCRDTLLAHAADSLRYYPRKLEAGRFGPGWAWDDYNEDYQPERSEMPIYGNCIKIKKSGGQLEIEPKRFANNVFFVTAGPEGPVTRLEHENIWGVAPMTEEEEWVIPFRKDAFLELLRDTLHHNVEDISYTEHPWYNYPGWKTIRSAPIDTVLRRMMHQSDNFIAEQLLLLCAGEKFDLLRQDTIIRWLLDGNLNNLPQRPKWVDGSGLSRYNLNSPQSIANVLLRLWREQPHERLFSLFPAGGVSGTITDWYKGKNGKPYVFAKSGSMGGVYCLSGYVVRDNGKVLIFSFMHNNFVGSSRPWRMEMDRVLREIAGQ